MQERRIINGWIYEKTANGIERVGPATVPSSVPTAIPLPVNPIKAAKEARQEARAEEDQNFQRVAAERTANSSERTAGAAERTEARTTDNDRASRIRGLAGDYNSDPAVKSYRVAIGQLGQALSTGEGAQADLALTYAFAKAMDPDSVVRESEQGMVSSSQPWFQAAVENAKKQFGMDGAGSFTPQAREALRRQIANSVTQRVKVYDARRIYFDKQAKALGVEPDLVTGEHDAVPFVPALKQWGASRKAPALGAIGSAPTTSEPPPVEVDIVGGGVGGPNPSPGAEGYDASYVSQGLSGINSGIANILGAPADLATAAINLGTSGINAAANTRIPSIDNPFLGSQSIKNGMGWLGAMAAPTNDPGKQFVRRVGESVGSAAPFAGAAGTLARGGSALAAAAGGGLGAAGARQAFPGNPYAEMAGEIAGGGATGAGLLGMARRNATRQMEAAVPTVPQLKEQASELYRSAEARGITADPAMTQSLADSFRAALAREGSISPTGRLSEVYPKAKEAMQLVDDYAGQTMSPTQLQTVRKVASDGLNSKEATDRRLGGILTDVFDQWAAPIAPELPKARDIASRYLSAEKLEQARELAGARAGQFSGSGFENALRTEYRGLDRAGIKGNNRFNDDTVSAIEKVSRGTPGSNLLRGMGKLYPSGVVSGALGSGLPGIGAALMSGSPGIGAAVTAGMAGIGGIGRAGATQMGLRAADQAELIARNGGALPKINVMSPEVERMIAWLAAGQSANYQNP